MVAASETLGVQCPWLHKDEKLLQLLCAAASFFFFFQCQSNLIATIPPV